MRKVIAFIVIILTFLLIMLGGAKESPDNILVIVNKTNPVDSLDKAELKKIFLGKKTHWDDGRTLIPINAKGGTALRSQWRSKVLELTKQEEEQYWQRMTAKLIGKEPKAFGERIRAVFKLKNSISYITRSEFTADVVKVVAVINNVE